MLHYLLALDTFPDDEKILKEHEELVDEVIKGTGKMALLLFNGLDKLKYNISILFMTYYVTTISIERYRQGRFSDDRRIFSIWIRRRRKETHDGNGY